MANNIDRANKATPEQANSFVKRIRNLGEDILSAKGRYAKEIKDIKDDINDIFEEAKNKGIPKKSLKAAIAELDLLEKLASVREGLDDDQQASLDDIREATVDIRTAIGGFADLPLGAAAVEADDKKNGKAATDASIIGAALGGGEAPRENDEAAAKEEEKRKIAQQRETDDSAFADLDSLKQNAEAKEAQGKPVNNVTALDPAAARAKRKAAQAGKAADVKSAADRAEAKAKSGAASAEKQVF